MSDYGRKEKTFGSGKNIWVDVPKVYPVGGKINTSGMTLGDVIPAGSICALNTAAGTIDVYSAIYTAPVAEVDTLTITAGCSTSGNVTVTLDGTAVNIAVLDTDATADAVAAKIAATSFAGWTVSAAGAVVTFTADVKEAKTTPTFSGGSTGVTGSFVVTVAGVDTGDGNVTISLDGGNVSVSVAVANGDDEATIAGKIAAKTYTGWKAVAVGAVVTFTADDKEDKGSASIDVASTGVTGSFVVTVAGVDLVYSDFSSIAVNGLLYNDVIVNEYTTGTVVYEGMVFEDMLEAPIPPSAKAKMPQITYFNHA